MLRLAANLILFISIVFFPWWITLLFAGVFFFKFSLMYEVIGWAFFMDVLYGTRLSFFFNVTLLASSGALVLFMITEMLKTRIRYYH